MIGDKRMEEPKTESETMDILEHFQILHDPKDYTFNMINALQLVELNNEVYEKMQESTNKINNSYASMSEAYGKLSHAMNIFE